MSLQLLINWIAREPFKAGEEYKTATKIYNKAKEIQKEEPKTYTQEEMDKAKSEAWWEGWHAYGESL